MKTGLFRATAVLSLVIFLSACESSEERAEKHFQSAVALLEAGDVERAMVEFRNVFQLDDDHREARVAYANAVLSQGRTAEAYNQFLRLVEQSPDDFDSRRSLAELAVLAQSWEEAERHYGPAVAARPEDLRIQAVGLSLAYRTAIQSTDEPARREQVRAAEVLLPELPDSIILRRILIDGYVRDGEDDLALQQIDEILTLEPDNRQVYNIRLQLLANAGENDAVEEQLLQMIARFEGDQNLEATLLRFYLSLGQPEKAEAYLRSRIDPTGEDDTPFVELLQFISQTQGNEVALAEVDTALVASPDNRLFRALRAGLLFELGQTDAGIEEMEAALAGAEQNEQTNDLKIGLARMLIATGNEVGARRNVEEVIANDPSNGEALKMSARWLIDSDQPDQAISALRTVLDQAPQDAEAMTLMAEAHMRNGSRALARDLLGLAVEASNNAPDPSIRYARLLLSEDSIRTAEEVLLNSLRLNPSDVSVLSELGQLYASEEDWARADQVVGTLRRLETEEGAAAANALQVAILSDQDRTEETVAFLEQLAQNDGQAIAAQIAISRAHLAAGDNASAVRSAETALAETPDNPSLRFAMAAIYAATGDLVSGEREYRTLLETNPQAEQVWLELIRVLSAQGKRDEALDVLNAGLAALPDAPNLLWAQASIFEQNQQYEDAIAVYEKLYAANSGSPVIANNLASLITTYRDDEESLQRAAAVARRLRDTEVPAFQDTYGWIAYRLGDYEEALEYLEPASEALALDPLVQFHLGMTYLALDRKQDALAQFVNAVEIAGETDTRPQFQEAKEKIDTLKAEGFQ